jgi:hypothetical protein
MNNDEQMLLYVEKRFYGNHLYDILKCFHQLMKLTNHQDLLIMSKLTFNYEELIFIKLVYGFMKK